MVSITAPTAGKPATLPSPTTVATELASIRLQVDADARLAAAVGGAARYFADAAGMANKAVMQWQEAIVAACQEAFENLTEEHPHLQVTLTSLPDRIEAAFSHEGETSPAMGLDTIAGFGAQLGGGSPGQPGLAGVDRVQYETQGGAAVTRFTKYFGQRAPSR
jgi:hypothetical protein